MKNRWFAVEAMPENGGLKSLILNDDPDRMNWIEGFGTWGVPLGFDFCGMEESGDKITAHYRKDTLELEAVRSMEENLLRERYIFRNAGTFDLYFQRGGLAIYTTFNDSYQDAATCIRQRCHAHIWCGGENSYVHALKMGLFPTEIALILTAGALDAYSVRREVKESSNDRGDFLLHPAPFHLLPGEETILEWVIAAFPQKRFKETVLARPGGVVISFEQETVFQEEPFRITVECEELPGKATVFCDGREIPGTVGDGALSVEYYPERLGEHRFDFEVGGRRFHAFGICVEPFEEILEKRIRFLLRKQQMTDPASPLYGAFLIYDNEEHAQYYNYLWRDHNASGERCNMGRLICRYLQTHKDAEADRALGLFEQFLLREIYDGESGEVFNDIGKHSEFRRPYNSAGLIGFWLEMYRLRRQEKYLVWIERSMRVFYENGGYRFYPNGTLFSDCLCAIRAAGRRDSADELENMIRKHVEQICSIGFLYPPHEVRFEQTITTPAVAILSAFYDRIEQSPAVLDEARRQAELLDHFQGDQPDYRLHEIPIRHWDEYWFGKRRLFGDTFPHYLSCLSARAFLLYAGISGDRTFEEKARRCMRNCLCLFFPDGTASCAYLYPFSVTMLNPDGSIAESARRGEFFDPWANDQDGALYLILCEGGKAFLE